MRPYLPPLLAGALARADTGIDFDGTDWSFLESPGFLAVVLALGVVAYLLERSGRRTASSSRPSPAGCRRQLVLGALLFAGALADGGQRGLARPGRRARSARARLAWRSAASSSARGRGSRAGAAALLTALRRRRGAAAGRDRDLRAAALVPRAIAAFVVPARGRPRGARTRSTPACGSCARRGRPTEEARTRGHRLAQAGVLDARDRGGPRAGAGRRCASAAPTSATASRPSRRSPRWPRAAIATGCGPGEHHIPSMNWYHRGEERYVEYGSSFPATRAFGVVRSLYDTVYNMNMAHLSRARRTVFEHLDDAGLRTACTTWLIYRGRTRHEPSGDERLPAHRRGGPVPPPGLRRARAVLRRPVRLARHRLHLGARHARPARPPHRLRGRLPRRARPVRLPALLAARQRHPLAQGAGPTARSISIAEADRALERIMHVAGGVDAFLEEHAVIVMSDHSQTAGRGAREPGATSSPTRACCCPRTRRRSRPSWRSVPSARSAMVYVLDESRRDELVPRRGAHPRGRSEGVDLVAQPENGEAVVRSRARRAALRARGRPGATGEGGAGASRASTAALALERRGRRGHERRLSRTRSAGSGRRSRARMPATCSPRPSRVRVRRLGRRRSRRRRQPRLAPPRRFARAC